MFTHINNLQQLIEQQATMIADLQNQQATAQNSISVSASIPISTPALRPLKVHITKPLDFDSNNYNIFKQAVGLYLLAAY